MKARWMDPNAGTFLSVDPLVGDAYDPQAVNAYSYARNNPVSYVDYSGAVAVNVGSGVISGGAALGGNVMGQLLANGGDFSAVNVVDAGLAGAVGFGAGFFFAGIGGASYGQASIVGAIGNAAEATLKAAIDTVNGKGPKSFSEFVGTVAKAAATGAVGGAAGKGAGKLMTPRNLADDAVAVQFGRGVVGEATEEALESGSEDEPGEYYMAGTAGGENAAATGAQNAASQGRSGGGGFISVPAGGQSAQSFYIAPPSPPVVTKITIICLAGPC